MVIFALVNYTQPGPPWWTNTSEPGWIDPGNLDPGGKFCLLAFSFVSRYYAFYSLHDATPRGQDESPSPSWNGHDRLHSTGNIKSDKERQIWRSRFALYRRSVNYHLVVLVNALLFDTIAEVNCVWNSNQLGGEEGALDRFNNRLK